MTSALRTLSYQRNEAPLLLQMVRISGGESDAFAKRKGPNRCRFGPKGRSRLLARSAAGRAAPPFNRRSRALIGAVVLDPLLDLPADQGAGSRTGRRGDVAVADVLADRAADDGADRSAGDSVLVFRVGRDGDFLVPALFGRGRCSRARGLRRRARSRRRGSGRLLLDGDFSAWLAEELIAEHATCSGDADTGDNTHQHRFVHS